MIVAVEETEASTKDTLTASAHGEVDDPLSSSNGGLMILVVAVACASILPRHASLIRTIPGFPCRKSIRSTSNHTHAKILKPMNTSRPL